ncbi:MAG: gamma-glutamyl-gamma-aminobutyrate hydrolase family protein [Candidatus Ventricola sp.]
MGNRPVIGISGNITKDDSYSLKHTYFDAILEAGGMPVLLPKTADPSVVDDMLDALDGVVLAGGVDIHPSYFGEEVLPGCGEIDEGRDAFELLLTRKAIQRGMPVLGICRGIQVLAVALGGTLFQDIESQLGLPKSAHRQEPPYDVPHHVVRFKEGGLFEQITGTRLMPTNSIHHQSIKDAGNRLVIEGITMDGIIEAVRMAGNDAVLGVQFHPEYLAPGSAFAARLFRYFVGKTKQS